MKLYSREQVSLILIVAIIVTALLGVGGTLLISSLPVQKSEPNIVERIEAGNEPVLVSSAQPVESSLYEYSVVEAEGNNKKILEGRTAEYNGGNAYPYSQDEQQNIDVYKRLNEGVVNITSISIGYNWFLEPVPQEEGTGSGSILDQEGHVLTNYHVVKSSDQVSVTLADGSNYKGEIIGVDPENDLAVIKFEPEGKKLTVVPLSFSDEIFVGQKVLAIGNPFGLDRTLTTGVVSAKGRPIKTDTGLIIQKTIQTDASINPGNSGGPLLNSRGEMIGINTMIYSPSGGSVGIGFAVPIDTARRVIPDLIRYGKVKRGWIDIIPVQLFPRLVWYADLPVDNGILVSKVTEGSPAEKAGIRGGETRNAVRYGRSIIYLGGDIIVKIDGTVVKNLSDMYSSLEDNKPGETVEVKVLREKKLLTFNVVLSERPTSYEW